MTRPLSLLLTIGLTIFSCATDNQAVDDFNNCITTQQREVLKDLEKVCDTFVKYNYPNIELHAGYRQFLKDLGDENDKWRTNDSISLVNTHRALKSAFGDGYDEEKAFFNSQSTVTSCLEKTSNSRFIDDFIRTNKDSGGGDGPNMVGWRIINSNVDPLDGQIKIVFLTEVVYRIVYFRTVK